MRQRGLIGRQAEENHVLDTLRRGLRGDSAIALLTGEPGVGKTTLAERCVSRLEGAVRRGRCWEGTAPPFGPLAEAMRDALRADEGLREGPAVCKLDLSPILPEAGPLPEEIDPDRVLTLLTQFWTAAGRRQPTTLLLEDLHWADAATLELLPRLAASLQREPVALLVTHRSEEVSRTHPLRRARAELRRGGGMVEIHLAALGADGTGALLTDLLGENPHPDLAALVHQRAQGIPFHIEELAAALIRTGQLESSEEGLRLAGVDALPVPDSIRDIVAMRLDSLSPRSMATLEVAAVLGGEFSLKALESLCDEEPALEELFDRAVLRESGPGRAVFRHALTREVVLEDLGWSRRRGLHRRVADLLEAEGAVPERIAEHLLAANDLDPARRWLLRAAERLCHIHAHRDAVDMASRALEIWPEGREEEARLDVLQRLARCAQSSGLLREAVRALGETLDSPAVADDAGRRAEALSSLATVHALQEQWEASVRVRQEAAETFEQAERAAEAVQEWLQLAGRQLFSMKLADAQRSAARAHRLAQRTEDLDLAALSLATRASVEALLGHTDDAKRMAQEALEFTLAHNLFKTAPEVYRVNAFVKEYTAEYADSLSTHQRVRAECAKVGESATARQCLGCMSWILFRQGEWNRALEVCQEIITDDQVSIDVLIVGHGVKAIMHAERGELRPAERHARESQRILNRVQADFLRVFPPVAFARIAEGHGRPTVAEQHYHEVLECWHRLADWYGVMAASPAAVIFWAKRGDESRLSEVSDALSKIAGDTGNPEAQAALALTLGEITMLRGDFEVGSRHLGQAADRFQQLNLPLEQLRCEVRHASALTGLGETGRAAERLDAALTQARRMGMRLLAREITEALALQSTPAAGQRSGPDSDGATVDLTPRQREVLALLTQGLTNKEIAARLHLSARTVDMHMRHLFDRLDVRSRTEAISRANDARLIL